MVNVRELAVHEQEYWNTQIQQFEAVHPLNAYAWGQVRAVDNWSPLYLIAEREGKLAGAVLLLEKRLPLLPFSILYAPKGPLWHYGDDETLLALIEKIQEIARTRRALFLRSDPNIPEAFNNELKGKLEPLGFRHLEQRWTYWNSPRDVSRINLQKAKTVEELFGLLDSDTRRCIRKAEREGVTVEAASTEEELKKFYEMFQEFSIGKGFMVRDYAYQRSLWERYIVEGNGKLFLAKYGGKIIGGCMFIMFAGKCLGMHMGSPYEYQKLQTNYAYLWESIKWAKNAGCSWYSFRGVGSTPTQESFKNKFQPEVVGLVGYYDYPFKPLLYKIFYLAEFVFLPRAWPFLVKGRKLYHAVMNRHQEGTARKPSSNRPSRVSPG